MGNRHIFIRRIGAGEVIAVVKANYTADYEFYLDPPILMAGGKARIWFEWKSTSKYGGHFKISVWDAKNKSLWSEDLARNPNWEDEAYNYLKLYHRDRMVPVSSQ